MELIKLGNVAKVISGYAFKSAAFKDENGTIPVIKIKNIKVGTAELTDAEHVSESFLSINEKYHVVPDDILISLTGSHMTQPNSVVGRVGSYPSKFPKALLNQRAGKVIPDEDLIDKTYLFYVLMQDDVRQEIAQMASGAASQANVSPTQVGNIKIAVHDRENQVKIAAALRNYDSLIENNNRRIVILEDMAQSLYREWFVHFRFPGHEQAKFVDSPLGRVPDGWDVLPASEVIQINQRTKLAKEGEKPFVPMSGLSESSMLIGDIQMKAGNSGAKFINGDTLFSRITPCLQNGKIGYVQFLDGANPVGFGSTEFIVLRKTELLSSEFIYLLARSMPFRENAIKSMTGATGRQRVQNACFDSFKLAIPPKSLLDKFTETVQPMFRSVFNLTKRNENLKEQRDMLLPKLISGQIQL